MSSTPIESSSNRRASESVAYTSIADNACNDFHVLPPTAGAENEEAEYSSEPCGGPTGSPSTPSTLSLTSNSQNTTPLKRRSRKLLPLTEGDKVIADRFRTKLCRNYLQHPDRPCPYEDRCMFAHGDHELRTAAQNLQDGLISEEAIRELKKKEQQERLKDKTIQWSSPPRKPLVIWPVLSESPTCPALPSTPLLRQQSTEIVPQCRQGCVCHAPEASSVQSSLAGTTTPTAPHLDGSFSFTDSPGLNGKSLSTNSISGFQSAHSPSPLHVGAGSPTAPHQHRSIQRIASQPARDNAAISSLTLFRQPTPAEHMRQWIATASVGTQTSGMDLEEVSPQYLRNSRRDIASNSTPSGSPSSLSTISPQLHAVPQAPASVPYYLSLTTAAGADQLVSRVPSNTALASTPPGPPRGFGSATHFALGGDLHRAGSQGQGNGHTFATPTSWTHSDAESDHEEAQLGDEEAEVQWMNRSLPAQSHRHEQLQQRVRGLYEGEGIANLSVESLSTELQSGAEVFDLSGHAARSATPIRTGMLNPPAASVGTTRTPASTPSQHRVTTPGNDRATPLRYQHNPYEWKAV